MKSTPSDNPPVTTLRRMILTIPNFPLTGFFLLKVFRKLVQ